MSEQSKTRTTPAPWRAFSVVVFIAAGIVMIVSCGSAALNGGTFVFYIFGVLAGVGSIANAARIARELLRERAARA